MKSKFILFLVAIVLMGCEDNNKDLIGKWSGTRNELGVKNSIVIQFYKNGVYKTNIFNDGETGKYNVHESEIIILERPNGKRIKYEYEIKDDTIIFKPYNIKSHSVLYYEQKFNKVE